MTRNESPQVFWVGMGCRTDCSFEELRELLFRVLAQHSLPQSGMQGLASIEQKAGEPGLAALAKALDLPLQGFSSEQLSRYEGLLSIRSARSFARTGCHGVAESAALAMAHAHAGAWPRLHVSREQSSAATVAIAVTTPRGPG